MRKNPGYTWGVIAALFAGFLLNAPAKAQLPALQKRFSQANQADTGAADTAQSKFIRPDVSRESPRASLERFFALTREGHFDSAAVYLDLPEKDRDQGPELARKLKLILDRHLWIELDSIPANALGDTSDGLPAGVDQLGTIADPSGVSQPVRLVRWTSNDETRWRFSRATVSRIPGWYTTLPDRWVLEHLPPSLLRSGPLDILLWQWAVLPIGLAIAICLGYIGSRILRALIRRLVQRRNNIWVTDAVSRLGAPFTIGCSLIAIALVLPSLALYAPAERTLYQIIRAGFFIVIVWSFWRIIDVLRQLLVTTDWALANPSSRALLPLGARTAKVIIFTIAVVMVFTMLGYPVASLIAGLGLGGLALALAAQKTVENLFGAFSLGVDQPFREGDFVKVEDFVGTVETIGLRSTRFRTLDRTLISIPNGKVAEMRLESYTARDRLRLATTIGLMYGTTVEQTREILQGFEQVLRSHPLIWPDAVVVRLKELGPTSIDIEIMAWFQTNVWAEFQAIRQEVLLQFMEVVERAGASFAVPTRALRFLPDQSDGEWPFPEGAPDNRTLQ
jgi:MscS family membrane protein